MLLHLGAESYGTRWKEIKPRLTCYDGVSQKALKIKCQLNQGLQDKKTIK